MSKLYAKIETAQKIADKLSAKGEAHTVIETNGQYQVVLASAPQVEEQLPDFTSEGEGVDTTAADHPASAPKAKDEKVTVMIPGAKLTKMYVITPAIGNSKVGPRPRWFERKRLVSAEPVEGGVKMVLSVGALTSRKIDLTGVAYTEQEVAA